MKVNVATADVRRGTDGLPRLLLAAVISLLAFSSPALGEPVGDPVRASLNMREDPLGLLFGIYGGGLEVGISEHGTIGSSFKMLQVGKLAVETDTYQFGLTGSYFWKNSRFETGPVLRGTVNYIRINFSNTDVGQVGRLNNWSLASIVGYHWQSRWGLNFFLGAGASYYGSPSRGSFEISPGSKSRITFISASGLQPTLETSVGWAL